MDNDWTQIFIALISLAGALLTGVVIPYIRAKTTKQQRDNIYTIIQSAVWAADQMFKASDPTGELRLRWVMNQLEELNLNVTESDLVLMVEQAVKELNIAEKEFIK